MRTRKKKKRWNRFEEDNEDELYAENLDNIIIEENNAGIDDDDDDDDDDEDEMEYLQKFDDD